MILTTKGRYAVMAVVDMIETSKIETGGKSKPVTLLSIADRQNISLPYLEQIFNKLKKSGIVDSVKGPGGGYILAQNPQNLTVATIINCIGEKIKMTRCGTDKKGCPTDGKIKCRTHHVWKGLEHQIFDYLNSISLQDVCAKEIGNIK